MTGRLDTGPVGVGVIGAGDISGAYLAGLATMPDIRLKGIAARNLAAAADKGRPHGVPAVGVADLLADPGVEIVLNLTPPAAHHAVGMAALQAGKHLWSEKPLGVNRAEVADLVAAAEARALRIGAAPDTFLGPASQAMRRALDEGRIGRPLTATAAYETSGPDLWHPDPAFLFDHGGGPLLDIGPYFVTELVHLLGSVSRVSALSTRSAESRNVATGPRAGAAFPVRVDTSVMALLTFRSGSMAQIALSFDAARNRGAIVELVGTQGQMAASDPDLFARAPMLWRQGAAEPLALTTPAFRRGLGVLDLARAIRSGAAARTNGRLALHVSEVLFAIASAAQGDSVEIASAAPEIAPLPRGWDPDERTLG